MNEPDSGQPGWQGQDPRTSRQEWKKSAGVGYVVVALALCLPRTEAFAQRATERPVPYERKVDDLVRRMTLSEKAGQLTQFASGILTGPGSEQDQREKMLQRGEVGSLLGVVGVEETNRLQHIAVDQSRLHIPLLFGFDVIHGYKTLFPIPLAMAATFDTKLVEDASAMAGEEARADGIRWVFSPMVDIARDARWGRISESAGEDPMLGSAMARAYVRGYQGARLDDRHSVAACVKHFGGYGASLAGRDYNTVDMSDTQLQQVYLMPYRAAVDAGVATVMTSFSALNGVPPTANAGLLNSTLRKDWNFDGVVVSDWGAVGELVPHGLAANKTDAAQLAIEAGNDIDMESGAYQEALPELVRSGKVPVAVVDAAVRRVLRLKYALGLFEHPYTPEGPAYAATPEKRAFARKAAEESFVLLKNDLARTRAGTRTGGAQERFADASHPLLPLDFAKGQTVALIGPLGDAAPQMFDSWSASAKVSDVRTLRQALQQKLGERLLYARGTDILGESQAGFDEAIKAARSADVVILALGEDGTVMSGEGSSRTRLDLPGNQQALLEAVVATGKQVVLALFSGRPLAIPWTAQHVPAILEAWLPGIEAGPALAAVLYGDVSPSGKLAVELPYAVGQEPLFLAQLPTGRPVDGVDLSRAPKYGSEKSYSRYIDEYNEPVFPFGWGLSYTTFAYGPAVALAGDQPTQLKIQVEVRNTGRRAGDEVAQLYFRRRVAPIEQPVRELKGFERVSLGPGESRKITFVVNQKDISYYGGHALQVGADGELDFWVGGSSTTDTEVVVHSKAGAFIF